MSHGRSKNAKAATLAAEYGVSQQRANQALEEDAPRRTAPPGEKSENPAEARPESAAEDGGPRMTSTQLASLHCLSRDQMESELVRLGLRGPADDGSTVYPAAEVSRRFADEDNTRFAAAAELLAGFTSNAALGEKILQEICDEEVEQWISANSLRAEIADLKKAIWTQFRKSHAFQAARRSGDFWRELAEIQEFERTLLDAIAARPKAERETSHGG